MSVSRGNASFSSPSVNPLVPESTGALLAEEWTIDPNSTLPSFLEMVLIEEAQRSAWETLKLVLSLVEDRLRRWSEELSTPERTRDISMYTRVLMVLKVPQLAQCVSEKVLAKYGAEIRCLIVYLLERRSLVSSVAATLSEALHGAKRVKLLTTVEDTTATSPIGNSNVTRQGKLAPMQTRDGIRYAMLLALGRYLMERSDWLYQGILEHHQPQAAIVPIRLQKLFRFLYPFLYSSSKGLNLIQRWKYLIGDSVFFDPYSCWLGLVVRRVVAEDSSSSSAGQQPNQATMKSFGSLKEQLASVLRSQIFRRAAVGLLSSLVGISWIARLQTSRRNIRMKRHMLKGDLPIPAPPKPLSEASHIRTCPPTHCPLCRAPRINPTASSSGYVFCLSCLCAALRAKPACPITGKDCPESSIIRLFEPNT